jgi:hypothetical protein
MQPRWRVRTPRCALSARKAAAALHAGRCTYAREAHAAGCRPAGGWPRWHRGALSGTVRRAYVGSRRAEQTDGRTSDAEHRDRAARPACSAAAAVAPRFRLALARPTGCCSRQPYRIDCRGLHARSRRHARARAGTHAHNRTQSALPPARRCFGRRDEPSLPPE